MAYNVTGLAAYTKQNVDLLVKNSVFEARTQKEILALGNVRVGVKSSEAIGRMDTDVFFQDDSSCGFNASGTTTFTQRSLVVKPIKVNEILCDKDLEPYYTQQALKAGGKYDSLTFAADYTDLKAKKVASECTDSTERGVSHNPAYAVAIICIPARELVSNVDDIARIEA